MQLQQFTLWDVTEQQIQGAELDQLVRLDFACIPGYLRSVLPNTEAQVRKIPFVARYAAELGGLYQRPVVRRFQTPLATQLPPEAWQKLGLVYDEARVDSIMSTVETGLWLQQSFAAMVLPYKSGVTVVPVSPWQMLPKVADSLRAHDVDAWESVDVKIPDGIDALTGTITYSKITLTPTEAWRYGGGKKTGIYAADGSHPFGRIPLVLCHRVTPEIGRPFAPINEPVHNLQIALCLLEAETELVIRHAAWPQKVITNAGIAQMTEQLQVGPDKVVALLRSGDPTAPGPDLKIVQGQLPVTELTGWIEARIKLYCAMLGIDPSAFLRVNTAVTVSARLFADATRRELRDRIRPVLERFERDLARLTAQVLNLNGLVTIPVDTLQVELRWQDWAASVDPVGEAQALQQGVTLGLRSIVDEVAQRDGLSTTAALAKVQANLAESRLLGIVQAPAPAPAPVEPAAPAPASDAAASSSMQMDAGGMGGEMQMQGLCAEQIEQLVEIVESVTEGETSPDVAIALITLSLPQLDAATVKAMVQAATAPSKEAQVEGLEAEQVCQLSDIVEDVAEQELSPAAAQELIALAFPMLDQAAVARMIAAAAATAPEPAPASATSITVETMDAIVAVDTATM